MTGWAYPPKDHKERESCGAETDGEPDSGAACRELESAGQRKMDHAEWVDLRQANHGRRLYQPRPGLVLIRLTWQDLASEEEFLW